MFTPMMEKQSDCNHKIGVVLPAGGIGKRMGLDKPKQLLEWQGRPLFRICTDTFLSHPEISEVVLCYPEEWKTWFVSELNDSRVRLVSGGAERWQSVQNGVQALSSDITHVLVHDVARPLISSEIISSVCSKVLETPCLVARPCPDTVKVVHENRVQKTLDRNKIWLAQTPQACEVELLKALYEKMKSESDFHPTDEASILEYFGYSVEIVPGDSRNDKITSPADLRILAWADANEEK